MGVFGNITLLAYADNIVNIVILGESKIEIERSTTELIEANQTINVILCYYEN